MYINVWYNVALHDKKMTKLKAMINRSIHYTHRKKNNYRTYPSIFKLIQSDKQHIEYGEKKVLDLQPFP